jgi:hypothetical protein
VFLKKSRKRRRIGKAQALTDGQQIEIGIIQVLQGKVYAGDIKQALVAGIALF